MVLESYLGS